MHKANPKTTTHKRRVAVPKTFTSELLVPVNSACLYWYNSSSTATSVRSFIRVCKQRQQNAPRGRTHLKFPPLAIVSLDRNVRLDLAEAVEVELPDERAELVVCAKGCRVVKSESGVTQKKHIEHTEAEGWLWRQSFTASSDRSRDRGGRTPSGKARHLRKATRSEKIMTYATTAAKQQKRGETAHPSHT